MQENENQKEIVVPQIASTDIDKNALIENTHARYKPKFYLIPLIAIILIVSGIAGYLIFSQPNSNSRTYQQKFPNVTNLPSEPKNAVFNLSGASFAQYKEVKSTVTPGLQPYILKSSELANLGAVASSAKIQFDTPQLSALESPGFFTQPTHPTPSDPNVLLSDPHGRSDDMVDLYKNVGGDTRPWERKPENAVFVTTDFLLHTYHILIDRTFQNIESTKMQPALQQLTQVFYDDAIKQYAGEKNNNVKDSWKRITTFYLVPLVLLNASVNKPAQYFNSMQEEDKYFQDDQNADSLANVQKQLQKYQGKIPSEIYQLASQEINLIMEAKEFGVPSPLYGSLKPDAKEDYTQYTPRSHYTRNSVLRSYFRAMMWYGRHGFDVKNAALTQDALLMTWQLNADKVNGQTASQVWEQIYLPTVFFVGRSDDLTFYEYSDLLKKIYGNSIDYTALTDTAKFQQFQSQAQNLPGPKILSDIKIISPGNTTKDSLLQDTKGFRFMGQRFIPDSYMFSSLTQGDEKPDQETGQYLPSTPTALMVMSILGSYTADSLLNDWVSTNAPKSDKVITKVKTQLKNEFQKFDEKTWTQNIYWSWLYNLLPLFDDHTNGYPMFMKGVPWAKKSLVSALGSWTELRHDTLLYAKQSFAEYGGGGEAPTPPPIPKGYVEPNLSFLTRLIALTTMTRDGLQSNNLLVSGQKEKFDNFLDSLQFFKAVAEKELSDATISDDDFEKLRTIITLNYPRIVWTVDGDQMTEKDARVGIIADVHTDACGRDSKLSGPCTGASKVLYEATGAPAIIYVAVKDKNGTRLTRGVTYSYYEFTEPAGGTRMTDEEWQGMIYDGKNTDQIPQQSGWTKDLLKP